MNTMNTMTAMQEVVCALEEAGKHLRVSKPYVMIRWQDWEAIIDRVEKVVDAL